MASATQSEPEPNDGSTDHDDRGSTGYHDDDLARMLDEVERSPAARAAFEDASDRREVSAQLIATRAHRSQRAVAEIMGTTQSAVSDLETGRVDPRLSTLQRYARAVGGRLRVRIHSGVAAAPAEAALASAQNRRLGEERSLERVLTQVFTGEVAAGPQSPSRIAARTGLPPPSVSRSVEQLTATGWLKRVSQSPNVEPRFTLDEARGLVIGASLHRNSLHVALTNLRVSEVLDEQEVKLPDRSPSAVMDTMIEMVDRMRDHITPDRDLVGLGVVLGGRVDGLTGRVFFAPDLQTPEHRWTLVPLEEDLETATGLRVAVENDANALAMHKYLRSGSSDNLATILITQEGIGAGFVVNGALMHGRDGLSGEIGHIVVDGDGRACRCGESGCLETVASPAAITRRVADATGGEVGSLEAASAMADEDGSSARTVFVSAGTQLGRVLSSVMATVGPNRLFVLGPPQLTAEAQFSSARLFMDGVRSRLGRPILGVEPEVSAGALENSFETRAAAAMAVHYFLSRPRHWVPGIALALEATEATRQ